MSRKLLAIALFSLACTLTLRADAVPPEEAPAPRPVGDKKPDAKAGKFGGKFGKMDPEKLKELKEKFGKLDPEKLKELKEKFGGKIDLEKLKELKGKFKKDNSEE